jgi:D-alanyl-D-alanine carboxypeptidase/D-alanyl-D-alanine-endopeptidase (penicillin-binding protein 4)
MRKLLFIAVSLFYLSAFGSVEEELKQWSNSSAFKGATWSFAVLDPESGELLFSYQPHTMAVPASVTKLISTATVLEELGSDYTYTTALGISGTVDSSRLNGNVLLLGSGDPSLGSDRFPGTSDCDELMDTWVDALQGLGIKKVQGAILVDDQLFGSAGIPGYWSWQDMGNYYAAPVGTINLNENRLWLTFKSGAAGSSSSLIGVYPKIAEYQFVNEVVSGSVGSGDNAYVFGAPGQNNRVIRGTIPPNQSSFQIKASVPDPEWFTGKCLEIALNEAGIEVERGVHLFGENPGANPESEGYEVLDIQSSMPLSTLVQSTNHYSINIYAEAFLAKAKVHSGSNEEAFPIDHSWLERYWSAKISDPAPFAVFDGSGLSRANGISALFLCQVLQYMQGSPNADTYFESLPIAGQTGTLRSLCSGQSCAGKVRAKSGTMNMVRSYAGYVKGQDGRWYPFAIMVNNFSGYSSSVRSRISDLLNELCAELGR